MARYIDVEKIDFKGIDVFEDNGELLVPLSAVRRALQMTPTADVIEIGTPVKHKYVVAAECAEIISKKYNIPLGDLVDVFAEIPAADVVPLREEKSNKQKHFTPDEVRRMTAAEVRKNYTAIMHSMKEWK